MTDDLRKDLELFRRYMMFTGVTSLDREPASDPDLAGKTLGMVHGSSWVSLFATYFGRKILPGVKLVAVGNDAVQLNFMRAHREGRPCPPQVNIELFVQYSRQLVELFGVDAVLITCSTMNRAAASVREALRPYGVPVIQIDEAMMEEALARGRRIFVVATHGPTVGSTQQLLRETAARLDRQLECGGATVEEAFHRLGRGDIEGHNELVAMAIRQGQRTASWDAVVLAQLSMSVFKLSHPNAEDEFGVPVLTSGECGFYKIRRLFKGLS